MFEKHRNSKQDLDQLQGSQANFSASASPSVNVTRAAVIGPGIKIDGEITGKEDLIVEGQVNGKIKLDSHQVDIGKDGQVSADITARVIKIAGEVHGDLNGTEKVVIAGSGNVRGNIVAPRMTLEDGAIFKGSIDMDPGEPEKLATVKPTPRKADKKTEQTSKVASGNKAKEGSGYPLNGG